MNRFLSLGLPLLCVCLTGCGSGMVEVSGVVRCNGKPLPSGTVQILGQDGIPRAGKIGTDGAYSVRAPVGPAKVIISCIVETPRSGYQGTSVGSQIRAAAVLSRSVSLIPQRYADWTGSGLTVQVERGKKQDFALTSP